MIAQVLVHHTGPDVGDLAALDQSVDDEGIKVLVVAHRYVNQEVFGAGDDKNSDGLGQRADPVTETVDDLPCWWPDPDGNERLYRPFVESLDVSARTCAIYAPSLPSRKEWIMLCRILNAPDCSSSVMPPSILNSTDRTATVAFSRLRRPRGVSRVGRTFPTGASAGLVT